MKTSNFSIRDFHSVFFALSVCFVFFISSCSTTSEKKELEKEENKEEVTLISENSDAEEKEETTTVVPHHGKAVDLSNNKRYMNITTARENRAEQISDINGPI